MAVPATGGDERRDVDPGGVCGEDDEEGSGDQLAEPGRVAGRVAEDPGTQGKPQAGREEHVGGGAVRQEAVAVAFGLLK